MAALARKPHGPQRHRIGLALGIWPLTAAKSPALTKNGPVVMLSMRDRYLLSVRAHTPTRRLTIEATYDLQRTREMRRRGRDRSAKRGADGTAPSWPLCPHIAGHIWCLTETTRKAGLRTRRYSRSLIHTDTWAGSRAWYTVPARSAWIESSSTSSFSRAANAATVLSAS